MSGKIKNFFKEVVQESKKVDWPSREQTINYTILVIGISAGIALVLGLLDALFFKILIR